MLNRRFKYFALQTTVRIALCSEVRSAWSAYLTYGPYSTVYQLLDLFWVQGYLSSDKVSRDMSIGDSNNNFIIFGNLFFSDMWHIIIIISYLPSFSAICAASVAAWLVCSVRCCVVLWWVYAPTELQSSLKPVWDKKLTRLFVLQKGMYMQPQGHGGPHV